VALVNAPAEALPFKDASFDGVTIGFGIRNVPDFRAGLREMLRVLRRGGRVSILEFSTPPSRALWKLYNYYFHRILPRIGGWLTGREEAYRYLTDSVSRFPAAAGVQGRHGGGRLRPGGVSVALGRGGLHPHGNPAVNDRLPSRSSRRGAT